jgi:hypothetical protein
MGGWERRAWGKKGFGVRWWAAVRESVVNKRRTISSSFGFI